MILDMSCKIEIMKKTYLAAMTCFLTVQAANRQHVEVYTNGDMHVGRVNDTASLSHNLQC